MGDEYATVCGSITESVSKAFAEDYCSNFLEVGEYADTEAAIYDAVSCTLDGIAIPNGKRVIIYSEEDFQVDILPDKTGPAIINNVQFWNNWCYNCVVTANWIQALLSYDGLQAGR